MNRENISWRVFGRTRQRNETMFGLTGRAAGCRRPAETRARLPGSFGSSVGDPAEQESAIFVVPDGPRDFTRDIGTQEVYEFTIRWP